MAETTDQPIKWPWQHRYIVVRINDTVNILPTTTRQAFPGKRIEYVSAHDDFGDAAIAALDAAEMQAGDECGWKYVVRHDPKGTGYSFIEIYDEDGEFVAKV